MRPLDNEIDFKGIAYIDSNFQGRRCLQHGLGANWSSTEQSFGGAVQARSKVQMNMLLKGKETIELELRVVN